MQDTIFTVELPCVETSEELEKIKALYPKYDPYFITSGCCREARVIFDKLWESYKPYRRDHHFLSEIRTDFHQRSWEMYVGNVLLERQLQLTIQSQNEGPDFVIDDIAYVECVAPETGDPNKPDSVPEMHVALTLEEVRVQEVPVDKMILRITSAIRDKVTQYDEVWKNKDWFSEKMPYVIAVNYADLSYIDTNDMPIMLRALFGVEHGQLIVDRETKQSEYTYKLRESINKSNKSPVMVNIFTNQDLSRVSGILYSSQFVLKSSKELGGDCVFVNNPFADYPVNGSFSKLFNRWVATKSDIKFIKK